jgi:hypothetical protein
MGKTAIELMIVIVGTATENDTLCLVLKPVVEKREKHQHVFDPLHAGEHLFGKGYIRFKNNDVGIVRGSALNQL